MESDLPFLVDGTPSARFSKDNETFGFGATEYKLDDGFFAEITVCPSNLNGRWAKVLIPKQEIRTITKLEQWEDAAVVGFTSSE